MHAHAVSSEPCAETWTHLQGLAVNIRCSPGQEICSASSTHEYWYRVVCGSAGRCVVRSDGRRQIVDLLLPGNFFGLSDCFEVQSSVEAISKGTVIATYPRRRVEWLADQDPMLAREIRHIAYTALARSRGQLLILGRITARGKVGAFLLSMAERTLSPADTVTLPVSRHDIADYLGLSAETVCRSLSQLKQRGKISFNNPRCVKILDRQSLEDGDEPYGS